MNGVAALEQFVKMNPERQMRSSSIYDEMRRLGFRGTENAVNVALANMAATSGIQRIKRGVYTFPPIQTDYGELNGFARGGLPLGGSR